jgi:luciferase-like monooxygenase
MDTTEHLCVALSAIPGVEAGPSRFGSGNRGWRIAGREFAHLHSSSLIDLRLPRLLQTTLRSDPRAHFRAGRSEWLELEFHSQTDVTEIAALARKAAAAARAKRK